MNTQFVLENIKRKRKELGLTQKDVALRLFMDERTYSKIERGGKKSLDVNLIFSLAEILGTNINLLLYPTSTNLEPSNATLEMIDLEQNVVNMLSQLMEQQEKLTEEVSKIKELLDKPKSALFP